MLYQEFSITDHKGNQATLTGYILENSPELKVKKRPAILICPGGGYQMTSDREAEPIAVKWLQYGFNAFVLRYSVAPIRYPSSLVQVAKAVAFIRENAVSWGIDAQKIVVAGFSAGGHLAANLGVAWASDTLKQFLGDEAEQWKPDALLLAYPVISSGDFGHLDSFKQLLGDKFEDLAESLSLEKRVSCQTPPTFLWHTGEDDLVPAENSLAFVQALRNHRIPVEYHLFSYGGHGLSLGNEASAAPNGYGVEESIQIWGDLFVQWFNHLSPQKETSH